MKKLLIIFSILLLISPGFSQTTVMTPFLKVFGLLECDSMAVRGMSISSGLTIPTKLVVYDSLRIGYNTTTDQKTPYFRLKGDADSDLSAITRSICTLTLAGNADPTLAYWQFSSTANRFKFGSATDYVSLEPGNTAGMLNIVIGSTDSRTGITFTGAASGDNLFYASSANYWSVNSIACNSVNCSNINTSSSIVVNTTVSDGENYSYTQKADFDSDAGVIQGYDLVLQATTNANPALGFWSWTSTGGKGYSFDKALIIGDSLRTEKSAIIKGNFTANTKAVVNDSLRVEETSLLKGSVTLKNAIDLNHGTTGVKITNNSDGALTFLGLGNGADENVTLDLDSKIDTVYVSSGTGASTLHYAGTISGSTGLSTPGKIVAKDSLRVEETVLIKGKTTVNDSLVAVKGIRTEGLAFLKDKVVINDSLRVEKTSILKGNITANDKLTIGDSLRVEKTALIKGKLTTNDSLITLDGFRTEGQALLKDKAVVSDSFRVGLTSIFKGVITAAGINSSSGIATTVNADITTSRYFVHSVAVTLTAATPGIQGDAQLSKEVNEVSTVANANNAVTLPNAAAGREIFIINNGANTLEIWPASGDNLGAGVNTATTLISGANITFIAYDTTNWEVK
jgi:predicted acyltransferase (DUF342 family)